MSTESWRLICRAGLIGYLVVMIGLTVWVWSPNTMWKAGPDAMNFARQIMTGLLIYNIACVAWVEFNTYQVAQAKRTS